MGLGGRSGCLFLSALCCLAPPVVFIHGDGWDSGSGTENEGRQVPIGRPGSTHPPSQPALCHIHAFKPAAVRIEHHSTRRSLCLCVAVSGFHHGPITPAQAHAYPSGRPALAIAFFSSAAVSGLPCSTTVSACGQVEIRWSEAVRSGCQPGGTGHRLSLQAETATSGGAAAVSVVGLLHLWLAMLSHRPGLYGRRGKVGHWVLRGSRQP